MGSNPFGPRNRKQRHLGRIFILPPTNKLKFTYLLRLLSEKRKKIVAI